MHSILDEVSGPLWLIYTRNEDYACKTHSRYGCWNQSPEEGTICTTTIFLPSSGYLRGFRHRTQNRLQASENPDRALRPTKPWPLSAPDLSGQNAKRFTHTLRHYHRVSKYINKIYFGPYSIAIRPTSGDVEPQNMAPAHGNGGGMLRLLSTISRPSWGVYKLSMPEACNLSLGTDSQHFCACWRCECVQSQQDEGGSSWQRSPETADDVHNCMWVCIHTYIYIYVCIHADKYAPKRIYNGCSRSTICTLHVVAAWTLRVGDLPKSSGSQCCRVMIQGEEPATPIPCGSVVFTP